MRVYMSIFFEESVDKRARRDSGNNSNYLNRSALERRDLCASFELYSNFVRGVVAFLSLKMCGLFFYKVAPLKNNLKLSLKIHIWRNFKIMKVIFL